MPFLSLASALAAIRSGGVVVYPTETFYAVGCDAFAAPAVAAIYRIKGRDPAKALPLVLGGRDQLGLVAASLPPGLDRLADHFWPGPLTVLCDAVAGLADGVAGPDRRVAVRVTSHPLAARLCREGGTALVATSANRSGQPAVAAPGEVAAAVVSATAGILADEPWPGGGAPSTLVACCGERAVRVLRCGAVSVAALRAAGFGVEVDAGAGVKI
ncbi:MAG: L-threonylcarbamoyladenylate synthase [Desulfovibrionaceae bacterium]